MPALVCPGCSRKLNVSDTLSGKKVRCPACASVLIVPAPTEQETIPPAPAPAEAATLAPAAPAAGETATLPPARHDPDATILPSTPQANQGARGDERAPPGYEVLGELGRGGMGVVYKARQVALDRVVALKMILSGAHAGEDEMKRFRTEAQAIARLHHPGIVGVYEIGEHDGRPFFALELCQGGALDRKLSGTPMQPKEAASLVRTLAEAMHAAHEAKVIHRDLKPANVLLTGDGTPKVTDFGLAKKLDEQGQTQTGSVMGTPSYMAPEQAEGKKNVGPLADVYSLGAILYECLTGRPPFRAATAFDTILQVVSEEPVPPRQLNAKMPRDLETISLKCLAKEPARRYASARKLGDDLGRFLAGEPIEARPVGAVGRAVKWVRRNPAVAALLALVFVALAAGTTVSTWFALDASAKATTLGEQKAVLQSQTTQLEKQAGELKAERNAAQESERKAQASAKVAEDRERETAKALEDVETTLVESLLRPMGRRPPSYDAQGRNCCPLDPIELESLRKLGVVRSDRARLRLIETGLSEPQAAERVGRRADWIFQAAVGLDRDRRRQTEGLVAWDLRRTKWEEVALACAWLGLESNCRDGEWAGRAVEALAAAMSKTNDPIALQPLSQGLIAVSGRLEAKEAAGHTGRAAEALAAAMSKATNPYALSYLAQGLAAVSGRLEAKEAAGHTGRAAEALAAAIGKNTDRKALYPFWPALKAVSGRLEPKEAAFHAGKVAEALAAIMSMTDDPNALYPLSQGMMAASEWLEPKEAGRAAEALAAAIGKTTNPYALDTPTRALIAVSGRLEAKEAAGHTGRAAEALAAAMSKTNDPIALSYLWRNLKEVSGWLEPKEAGRAAEALAAAMSKATNPYALSYLAQGLAAVSGRLEAKEAAGHSGRAAEALAAAMSKATGPADLNLLAQGLAAVSGRLEAKEAAGHSGRAAEALAAAMSKATNEAHWYPLSQGLKVVITSFSTRDLVAVLAQPLCAGSAQRAVLDVLGARCKREFRNAWHFIDWADSNGIDLLTATNEGDSPR